MRFRIPGNTPDESIYVRLWERVTPVDAKDHYFDTGLEYADGSKDTLGVGGQFATLTRLAKQADADAVDKAKTKATDEPVLVSPDVA